MADINGQSIVLNRTSKGDRVPGIWIQGHGKAAIVVDPRGSAAALKSDVTARLRKAGRPILLLDVFQTAATKAPRDGDPSTGPMPKPAVDGDDEDRAEAVAGYPKFLTFNVSVDAARVQDIVTAIAYANRSGQGSGQAVEIFATGDAALWSIFASAVSTVPVSVYTENVPKLTSNADYLEHFNVPGILCAGGITTAERLAKTR